MGSIPFQIMEDVLKSFQDFYNNSINWIELGINLSNSISNIFILFSM